jgi:phage-related protein (TIGR01555 family)
MKKDTDRYLNNSLTDLVSGVRIASMLTGGSQLASYEGVAYNNNYSLLTLNRIILTYLYTSSGIIQTAIDLPVQDALSKGIEIESGQMSSEEINELLDYMEQTDQWEALRNAWNWNRLYGGAGLVLATNQEPEERLDWNRLPRGPIRFYDVDRWQFDTTQAYSGGLEDGFYGDGGTDTYFLYGQQIHETRVIRLNGKRAPYYVRRQLRGWGMSEAERMIPDLNLYLKTKNVLYEILDESKIDIYRLKGFAQKLLQAGGTEKIQQRVQLANELKNYVNALIMDLEDEYEQKQMSFGGLAEISTENRMGIASALRIPQSKLFGIGSTGFSSGEDDLENYNMMLESEVRRPIGPVIRRMIEINMFHLFGRKAPFKIKWPSLRVLSAEQEQNVKDSQFNRTMALYDRGLLDSKGVEKAVINNDLAPIDGPFSYNPEPPAGPENVNQFPGIAANSEEKNKGIIQRIRK